MKTKTDDTAWSGYDPTQGPPILKAVDDEVKSTSTSDSQTKLTEAELRRNDRLDDLAERCHELNQTKAEIDEELAMIEGEIAHYFPEEEGELYKHTKGYGVTVTRSERWAWDKEELEKHFGQTELPDYVNRALSVDKRKFKRLPADEQAKIKSFLTRHLNSPKVKVVKNV